jgi:hypothetical protein
MLYAFNAFSGLQLCVDSSRRIGRRWNTVLKRLSPKSTHSWRPRHASKAFNKRKVTFNGEVQPLYPAALARSTPNPPR